MSGGHGDEFCWFASTNSDGCKWRREYSHIGRHCCADFLFISGFEQARISLLLLLVRDPQSLFPLDDTKHIKHRLHDDATPSNRSSPNLRTRYSSSSAELWQDTVFESSTGGENDDARMQRLEDELLPFEERAQRNAGQDHADDGHVDAESRPRRAEAAPWRLGERGRQRAPRRGFTCIESRLVAR